VTAANPAPSDALAPAVAIQTRSAQTLADRVVIIQDLQFVMDCCKRVLAELSKPDDELDGLVPPALWTAALIGYGRCFGAGGRFGLTTEDVRTLPLQGEVMKFHQWVRQECRRFTVHPADPLDAAKVGAALTPAGQPGRRVTGIAVLTARHVLVDGAGVRQLGTLASELAKQAATAAQADQDTVLAEVQALSLDQVCRLTPLPAGRSEAG
jgi:hypothetical protein